MSSVNTENICQYAYDASNALGRKAILTANESRSDGVRLFTFAMLSKVSAVLGCCGAVGKLLLLEAEPCDCCDCGCCGEEVIDDIPTAPD